MISNTSYLRPKMFLSFSLHHFFLTQPILEMFLIILIQTCCFLQWFWDWCWKFSSRGKWLLVNCDWEALSFSYWLRMENWWLSSGRYYKMVNAFLVGEKLISILNPDATVSTFKHGLVKASGFCSSVQNYFWQWSVQVDPAHI